MMVKYEGIFVDIDELKRSFDIDLFIQIVFDISRSSLDDYANTMVENGWGPNDYQIMKNTNLSDISFEIDNTTTFKIKNKQTNDFIVFSNRTPTAGELRGINLRNNLLEKKLTAPRDLTLYQALIDIIRNIYNSDSFTYLLRTFSGIQGFAKTTDQGGVTPYFKYFKREMSKLAANCQKDRENGLIQALIKQKVQHGFDRLLDEFTQANHANEVLLNSSDKNIFQRNRWETIGTAVSGVIGVGVGLPLALTGTFTLFGVGLIGKSLTTLAGFGSGLLAGSALFGPKVAYDERNLNKQGKYLNKFKSLEPFFANETTQEMKPSADAIAAISSLRFFKEKINDTTKTTADQLEELKTSAQVAVKETGLDSVNVPKVEIAEQEQQGISIRSFA
jgi:hypothetical protein